jgi:hypothetical protein
MRNRNDTANWSPVRFDGPSEQVHPCPSVNTIRFFLPMNDTNALDVGSEVISVQWVEDEPKLNNSVTCPHNVSCARQ